MAPVDLFLLTDMDAEPIQVTDRDLVAFLSVQGP